MDMKSELLYDTLTTLRRQLEQAFAPDTAAAGFPGAVPSTGHCAAVATIVHLLVGGYLVSTDVEGHSHWLNRLLVGDRLLDVDLTGDQFGGPPIQVTEASQLYPHTRVRDSGELSEETLARARLLAHRAGLANAERAIEEFCKYHPSRTQA